MGFVFINEKCIGVSSQPVSKACKSKFIVLHIIFFILLFCLELSTATFAQRTLPVTKDSGMFTIACYVNGEKLKFSFDKNIPENSILLSEVLVQMKAGTIKESDIRGATRADLEKGILTSKTKIILREVQIGGLPLAHVQANIVAKSGVPLLLGKVTVALYGEFQLDTTNLSFVLIDGPESNFIDRETLKKSAKFPGTWSKDKKYKFVNLSLSTTREAILREKPNPTSPFKLKIPAGTEVYVLGLNIEEGFDYFEIGSIGTERIYGYVDILDINPILSKP